MRLFECNRCRGRKYAELTPKVCEQCEFNKFTEVKLICLLLPAEQEPTFPIVHKSGEVPSDDGGVKSIVGQQWVTACKARQLPPIVTAEPSACTCKLCCDWLEKQLALTASPPENVGEQQSNKPIEATFEGFDDEPYPSEDAAFADVQVSEPEFLPNGE